jgi:tetratricopeptide (TPR) repeat protein
MKTNAKTVHLVLALSLVALFDRHGFSQSTHTQSDVHVNPLTGLPADAGSDVINPVTGLPSQAQSSIGTGLDMSALQKARTLYENGRYADSLQCYLELHTQARTSPNSPLLKIALPSWIGLGEKYPKAKQALVDIRDQDTRELSQGRGALQLFREVADINDALGNNAATVELFKRIRRDRPSLAHEGYLFVEPVLVRCGNYQLCLDCIGNPETRFKLYCYTFKQLQAFHQGVSERFTNTTRKEEFRQLPGRPPIQPYQPANLGEIGLKHTRDSYADEVCRLIEILVGTGHHEEAERIRDQAVAVLDHPRLKSAVTDADQKLPK